MTAPAVRADDHEFVTRGEHRDLMQVVIANGLAIKALDTKIDCLDKKLSSKLDKLLNHFGLTP